MTIEEKVKQTIKDQVNPQLVSHGGFVELTSVEDKIAFIKMLGECGGCPSQQFTVEDVVKPMIVAANPEIEDVVIDNSVDEDFIKYAKELLGTDVFND